MILPLLQIQAPSGDLRQIVLFPQKIVALHSRFHMRHDPPGQRFIFRDLFHSDTLPLSYGGPAFH